MRTFNIELFNETIEGTVLVESSSEHNEELGRANQLAIQVHAGRAGGTSPTITVKLMHSNDGRFYLTHTTLINAQSLAAGTPYDLMVYPGSAALGAYLKVTIQLGGTDPSAYTRIVVCGRDN